MATAPRLGFAPCKSVGSGADNKGLTEYTIANGYATALGTGDLVALTTDGSIVVGTNSARNLGVFHGVTYTDSTGKPQIQKYWPASTTSLTTPVTALVMDSPTATYNMVANGPVTLAIPGAIYAVSLTAPNASTGRSTMTVNNVATRVGTLDITTSPTDMTGLANLENGDIFSVKSSIGNVANSVTIITNQTLAQFLAALNGHGVTAIADPVTGFLDVKSTDGGTLIIAQSTGTPLTDQAALLGATGTVNAIVAASAGAVEVVKVIDTVNLVLEVRLTDVDFRSNLEA